MPGTVDNLELTTIAHIRSRYEMNGPHATAVLDMPMPGTSGDDAGVRWRAARAELLRLGTSAVAIRHMDDVIAQTHRRGHPLLVTANEAGAAICWLGFDIESSTELGALPALLPTLHQAALAPVPVIGAAIDRIGADVHTIGAFDVLKSLSVDGDDEHVHKAASGGWSQARHQRHSEVIWERNAELVAIAITQAVKDADAHEVVLTGDNQAVRLVAQRLASLRAARVVRKQAGGRHEPGTPDRLTVAASEVRVAFHDQATGVAVANLREELGQHDRAVAGWISVLEALNDHRVRSLFVDLLDSRQNPQVDSTIHAAFRHGANVVVGDDLDVCGGIAALLSRPYD